MLPKADYPANQVEQWLTAGGFHRGNPFATTSADEEREGLAEDLFVPIASYDLIQGNRTVLIFAPRGSGKSALRIRLAVISLPPKAVATTLAVECTDFGWLAEQYRKQGRLTEQDYATFLLRQAMAALLAVFTPSHSLASDVEKQLRAEKANRLSMADRADMAVLMQAYAPGLLEARSLYRTLEHLSPANNLEGATLRTAVAGHKVGDWLAATGLADDPVAMLLADLADEPVNTPDPQSTPLEHFKVLVQLAQAAGIHSIHFLIDRLDEMQLFASNYETQADILEPLLAYLNLIDLPGLAFKFFLAHDLEDVLAARPAIRPDRLLNESRMVRVTWDAARLKELLRQRLLYFSDNKVESLTALCGEDGAAIEANLLEAALGSPRRLLTAAHLLCQTQVALDGGLISQRAWQKTREQLVGFTPTIAVPPLVLHLDKRKAEIAGRAFALTKKEVEILRFLVEAGGTCEREALAEKVWGAFDGVTEETMDQAVSRLRKKLGDTGRQAVYLQTLRGTGFRLDHYELSG